MQATLALDDRPRDVVQDDDMGSSGLDRFGWNHKDASADFGNSNLPRPFESTDVAFAQASVDCKQHHPGKPRGQLREEPILLVPSDRVGFSRRFRQHADQRWRRLESRPTVIMAIGPCGALEDSSDDLQACLGSSTHFGFFLDLRQQNRTELGAIIIRRFAPLGEPRVGCSESVLSREKSCGT